MFKFDWAIDTKIQPNDCNLINTNNVLGGRILAFSGGHVGVKVKILKFYFYEIKMMKLEQLAEEMQTCGAIW